MHQPVFHHLNPSSLTPLKRATLSWLVAGMIGVASSASSVAASLAPLVKGPQVDSPKRVLFIGNSYMYYSDSLHNHVRRMVGAGGIADTDSLEYKSSTIGGSALEHHPVDWLTTPGRIGIKQPFELVIMQGGSAEPLSPARAAKFRETLREHNKIIRERGGRVALYMTHVYTEKHRQHKPENIRLTEAMYVEAGNDIGALVIPVGLAFEEAYRRHPDLQLHNADGTHPSMIGTYLAACTVFASVYGRSPVGNRYTYGGAVDAATALKLQQVAQDTVERFYRR